MNPGGIRQGAHEFASHHGPHMGNQQPLSASFTASRWAAAYSAPASASRCLLTAPQARPHPTTQPVPSGAPVLASFFSPLSAEIPGVHS